MPGKRKRDSGEQGGKVSEARASISDDGNQVHGQNGGNHSTDVPSVVNTPTKPRRGRPPGSGKKPQNAPNGVLSHPTKGTPSKSKGKVLFSTPVKLRGGESDATPVPIERNADRSARRKSARNLLDRAVTNGLSDEDDLEEEDILARKIWEEDEDDEESDDQDGEESAVDSAAPTTPSRRRRGRRKKISPTPPQDLPPQERYFWDNRPGKIKTSNNTLSSLSLLTHSEYHNQITNYADPHTSSYTFLHTLHTRSFPQWHFELSENFSICLYGYGSKRNLLTSFARHLHANSSTPPKIQIVNGYTPTLTLRQILTTLATQIYNYPAPDLPKTLSTNPPDLLTTLLSTLTSSPPNHPIYILINSLDAPPLRKPQAQSLLSDLAAHPSIHFLATCDTPNFPLLWSTATKDTYNFLFHDATTFTSYAGIEIPNPVDDVNDLLGRSGRSVKGKEGVGFVLRSLPENARALYRVLVSEVLVGMDEGGGDGDRGADGGLGGGGVEYKTLYRKVVEEFICSSEMGFRQLLKEFFDHQMIVSRREGGGGEVLGVPWRREECEAILEELIG